MRSDQKISYKDRKKIVKMLDTGKYSLRKVGGVYGVSYNRIRQIYKMVTGKPYGIGFELRRKEKTKTLTKIRSQYKKFRKEGYMVSVSIKKTAKLFNYSTHAIRKFVHIKPLKELIK
jgi:AraC-like DNA-binding protein